jgi:23S rRNA pseudouridine1911/1915/1917 synthase
MDDALELRVTEADAGLRLDRFLVVRAARGGRAQVSHWLREGRVTVDGRLLRKGDMLRLGQCVRVAAPDPVNLAAVAAIAPPLTIVREDAQLVVIDKPARWPTHGHAVDEPHTLTAQLCERYPEMRGVGYRASEPGILHRLDNDTSGLLLAARDQATFDALRALLKAGAIRKRYLALCVGEAVAPRVFEGFLVSDRGARVKVSPRADKRSRPARTELTDAHVVDVKGIGACSLLTVTAPHAGRHQIRAHLADAGHPLVGDRLYGGPTLAGLDRHFLHASALGFQHPVTREPIALSSALPPELQRLLDGV